MKGFVHSRDLEDFNLDKTQELTIYRKKPKCDDVRCKVLKIEAKTEKGDNRNDEDSLSDQDKKELEAIRNRLAKHNSRR